MWGVVASKSQNALSDEVRLHGSRSETFSEVVRQACERRGIALMGVCNVTPDSFSDGGRFYTEEAARAQVDRLLSEGADIIDIGGESTRPGATPVSADEQQERILSVVRYASARACVSVDTTLAPVADACLRAGAVAINDVSCLADPALANVAAAHVSALILMHARGPQAAMQGFGSYPEGGYGDVYQDVVAEWRLARARAVERGVAPRAIFMDPGLGFSKTSSHSTTLLQRTADLVRDTGAPVVIGASRKSFLRVVDETAAPSERLGASIGAALVAASLGASIVRIHDVRATRQALDTTRLFGRTGLRRSEGASPP